MRAPAAALRALLYTLWRVLRGALLVLAATVLFIEEWGWRPLTAWAARIARWPPLARLETRIGRATPAVALALFLVPAVLLFPVKLLALWFVHIGRGALGVVVIVLAKLVGTAVVGRLFILTEPQLIQYAWFARALAWWRATKAWLRATIRAQPAWRAARVLGRRWLAWLRQQVF
jgi:hypothetical protein